MDRLESLTNSLSQITMYDIKNMYNQAKNVVFNVSEMEAKVRDATNDEPWGASSTLMNEIAQGTFNFQNFNEIMPAIYSRFMEKEARQWRQIYKALQLLEYLVKNGSERVVDDARSHISTIKMLRNFYYIDDKGKDQGINVRNRSRELVELLSDVDKIRIERRKAKANKHKYTGVGNDAMSFSSGGSRYDGFGSESMGYGGGYGGGSGEYGSRDFGAGGSNSYSGGGSGSFRDDSARRNYEEYDAGDDEVSPRRSNSITRSSPTTTRRSTATPAAVAPPAPKAPEPAKEIDLLGMDDDAFGSVSAAAPAGTNTNKALPALASGTEGDDDFDDFIAAPTTPAAPTAPVVPQPAKPTSIPLFQQLQTTSSPLQNHSPPLQTMSPAMQSMAAMNRMSGSFTPMSPSVPATGVRTSSYMSPSATPAQNPMHSQPAMAPMRATLASTPATIAPKPATSANFEDLWSLSLGSSTAPSKATAAPSGSKSMKDLEKEKAQAGIWGSGQARSPMGAAFGSFSRAASTPSATPANSSSNGGLDDLLF